MALILFSNYYAGSIVSPVAIHGCIITECKLAIMILPEVFDALYICHLFHSKFPHFNNVLVTVSPARMVN